MFNWRNDVAKSILQSFALFTMDHFLVFLSNFSIICQRLSNSQSSQIILYLGSLMSEILFFILLLKFNH